MTVTFTTIGALIGLVTAIALINLKVQPAYSLILGALIGGVIGGGGLDTTIAAMITGCQGMVSAVLRILTSGILAGALIMTGSAEKIADEIVNRLGSKRAFLAIGLAAMIICGVGVFITVTVITVAPIALAIGKKAGFPKEAIVLAIIGGGKAGNIISPNSNTIAVAEAFQVNLTSLMMKNMIPAIVAVLVTALLAALLSKKPGIAITDADLEHGTSHSTALPSIWAALSGPAVVIFLLAMRPLFQITVDPLIALPIGGVMCTIACGHTRQFLKYAEFGLNKVMGVSILLLGTGAIAGIIKASSLPSDVLGWLQMMNLPTFLLAPVSGILMAAATASTTAGSTVASQTFAGVLTGVGISALSAGAMVHCGAIVIDSLPHGSFFHASCEPVNLTIKQRTKLIGYEAIIGFSATLTAVLLYLSGH